jgi:glycosyltransferase involved in cell wall biosynthesis
MGRQGRAFVEERFSWDIILAKFQALFETLTVK